MEHLTLRRVGDALVVAIPTELLERYDLREGDMLRVARDDNGFVLQSGSNRLKQQIDAARTIMNENAAALDLLAR